MPKPDESASFLAGLNEAALRLLHVQDRDSLLHAIVREASRLLEAEQVGLALLEDGVLTVRALLGNPKLSVGQNLSREDYPAAWAAIDARHPHIYSEETDAETRSVLQTMGAQFSAVLPVLGPEAPVGIFGLARRPGARAFTTADLDHGRLLGQLAALVWQNFQTQAHAATLAETAERLQDLFDNVSDLVQSVAPDGRIHYVNRAWRETLGYSDAEVATMHIFDVVAPECRNSCQTIFRRLMEGEPVSAIEATLITRDGRRVQIDGSVTVRERAGQPIATRGIFRDVTKRKLVEEEYAAIIRSNFCGFMMVDCEARILETNDALCRLLGYTAEELRSVRLTDLEAGQSPEDTLGRIARVVASGTDQFETRHRRKDGEVLEVEISAQYMPIRGGAIMCFVSDHTERRRAQAAQARTVEFMAALHQTTMELLANLDRQDLFHALVRRAASLLSSARAEIALLDGEVLVVHAAHGREVPPSGERSTRAEAVLSFRAIDTCAPVVVDDFTRQIGANDAYRQTHFGAVAVLPILRSGRCLGVLGLMRDPAHPAYGAEDIQRAELFASLAALVLHNAAVYEDARSTAETRMVALRATEERFRAVFDQSPLALLLATVPDGRILEINTTAEHTFGYDRRDVIGRTSLDLQMWVDLAERARFLDLLRTQGRVTDFDATMRRRDGQCFTAQINTSRITLGSLVYSLSAIADITLVRRAQADLVRSEARLHEAQAIAQIGSWELDLIGNHLHWSPMIYDIFEIDPDSFGATYEAFLERVHPDDRAAVDTAYTKSVRERTPYEVEHRLLFPDGRIKHVIERGRTDYDAGGAALRSRGTVQDITARKSVEEAARKSELQFENLFEFAPDATIMADQAGRIVRLNRRAEELFGYTREELLGQTIETLVPECSRGNHQQHRGHYVQHARPRGMGQGTTPLSARRKDGTVFPAEISLGPVETEHGLLIAAAIRDLTVQRAIEAARQEAETRLRQAQKLESLGTLAGGIAHDFNNILTGMLGFVELARGDLSANHPGHLWLQRTTEAGLRAKALVHQILTFGRQTEGERAPMRLQKTVADAVTLVRSTLPLHVRLETEFDAAAPAIDGDSNQLHQVVVNLCTNAWHALSSAGGRIIVRIEGVHVSPELADRHAGMPTGATVRLSVSDNGAGMAPEVVERIFDPFFTTKSAGKGTGLGLAVVDGIIRSHRGCILVQSEPGVGSTFNIYLPALAPTPEPVHTKAGLDLAARNTLPQGHGERILLVDDQRDSREVLSILLRQLGYSVTSHAGSRAALEEFTRTPRAFAAVLSDLAMPDLSGAELARVVLAFENPPPVIIITGFVPATEHQRILSLGVRQILSKPPSLAELATAVAAALVRTR